MYTKHWNVLNEYIQNINCAYLGYEPAHMEILTRLTDIGPTI